jgi:hypothetical protein
MKTYSFYRAADGMLMDMAYSGPPGPLNDNTPAGYVAIEGRFDHMATRIDVATGLPVDFQPTAPPDDEAQTWAWDSSLKRWAASPTQAAILSAAQEAFENAAQESLDATARAWGYDSLLSAASYATSAVAQFRAEALALIAWRDAVWGAAYTIQAAVSAGEQALPATAATFVALLPGSPERPSLA